jgi:tRNA (mo5U34)-methyltransferase
VNLLEQARELPWYHTIELAPGEVTDGQVDLRPHVHRYGLPERMDGLRALDVGTFDGFWAFEMERRGADVVAIDIASERDLDVPANRRALEAGDRLRRPPFQVAREALGSDVERRELSLYAASPDELGTFDVVLCGSVLIHLRDPVLAMESLAALCRKRLILVEPYHWWLSLLPFALAHYRGLRERAVVFWEPNVRSWRRMMQSAGFAAVDEKGRFTLRGKGGWHVRHVVLHGSK